MAVELCSQETGVEPWLTSRVTLGNSRHLSGLFWASPFLTSSVEKWMRIESGKQKPCQVFQTEGI